jgi:RNA polymerase sigma-70 factor (ECF subfamily)
MNSGFISIWLPGNPYQAYSDEELVRLYKKRKRDEIINEVFNRYHHLVYPICRRYLKDDIKSKDSALEIFGSLGDKMVKYEIKNFRAWLCTVTRNECLMQLRKVSHEISSDGDELFRKFAVENEAVTHLVIEEADEDEEGKLNRLLLNLKSEQKLCLEMMYFQRMSYKEISVVTGLSLKQVKSNIQNGKRNLRQMFENRK